MRTEILKEIGLTESETKVYLALLELGDSTRGEIVNKSGIAGSKVYEILEKLQEKGLVSIYLQNNIKHFKPTNPKQILGYLEDKKQQISKTEAEVKSILPNLLSLYGSSKEEQEVELISGLKGLELIFKEQIEAMHKGDTCYVIGGTKGVDEEIVQAFFEKVHIWRREKGIKTKMLFNLSQKESTERLYSSKKYPDTTTRYIRHTSPVAINVYKNKTIIIIFGKKMSAISIKSADVAKSFIEYFNLLWTSSKR
ncbi:MAG: helix-turn-helix domain-containing protein [Candidatus Woesearchaeota archaeon]|nr:helix-turn-helix domain-containing protein [Candidatus Woesearchaeota archaeon]